jgi:hypothetical protein
MHLSERKPVGGKESLLCGADRMIRIQQVLRDLGGIERGVCHARKLRHTGRMSSRRTVTTQWNGSMNSTS